MNTPRERPKKAPRRLKGAAYRALCVRVFRRAASICEEVVEGRRCCALAVDAHHVVFRSQGGEDTEANLLALCRQCHAARHGVRIIAPFTPLSKIGGRW